jgi:hypothetical protein
MKMLTGQRQSQEEYKILKIKCQLSIKRESVVHKPKSENIWKPENQLHSFG